ncbi:MAG: hypothetical protein GF398_01370 [Chitinivibrionales bacterium]|nr:hypothetical protein [Chitinivibrionales bacterium]
MSLVAFLVHTVLISFSGVMAPGPMTAVALGKGARSPWAGIRMSFGHGIVEIPLMLLLLFGFSSVFSIPHVKVSITFAGAAFLLYLGIDLLGSLSVTNLELQSPKHSDVGAGILMSAGNPYFLLWWAAIGIKLITEAKQFGPGGFALFTLVHWACDLVWLTFLSCSAYMGNSFLGARFQKGVFLVSSFVLLYYGSVFLIDAFKQLQPLLSIRP